MVTKIMLGRVMKEKPKKEYFKDKVCFACEICGFAYESQETAEKCEAWCREHHNCSMEITKKAVNR